MAVSNARVCKDQNAANILVNGKTVPCTADQECLAASGNPGAWCDAVADKIQRDVFRFEDVRRTENALYAYGIGHRHCSVTNNLVCFTNDQCPGTEVCQSDVPLLDAGTFLRGWSASRWPSWASELGNTLGVAVAILAERNPPRRKVPFATGVRSDTHVKPGASKSA